MAFLEDQSALTMQSVVDQISAFAVANAGFSALPDVVIGGDATTTMKILLKNGMYYYLLGRSEVNTNFTPNKSVGALYLRMMKIEPTLTNYSNIIGAIDAARCPAKLYTYSVIDGPFQGLNLYTDGNAVHAIIEVSLDVFSHLSFGIVDKFGTWTGGEYAMASGISGVTALTEWNFLSASNTYIFDGGASTNTAPQFGLGIHQGINFLYRPLPIAGPTNSWTDYVRLGQSSLISGATQRAASSGYFYTPASFASELSWALYSVSPNATTLRAMLIPIYLRVSYELDNTLYHLCGHIPSVKYLNIDAIEPKDLVDTNWRVYPYVAKFGDATVHPISGNFGLAYLRA